MKHVEEIGFTNHVEIAGFVEGHAFRLLHGRLETVQAASEADEADRLAVRGGGQLSPVFMKGRPRSEGAVHCLPWDAHCAQGRPAQQV